MTEEKKEEKKWQIKAIDLLAPSFDHAGVAYYRLTPEFREFLMKCKEKHGILGFEWEEGSWNFGIILRHK